MRKRVYVESSVIREEPDPVEEIRVFRAANLKKYKTLAAYAKHLQSLPPAEELHARIMTRLKRAKSDPPQEGKRRLKTGGGRDRKPEAGNHWLR